VPGLSNLPGIGRVFSNNDDTVNKTEIVLLITPRVVRNLIRPDVRLEEFHSGTEAEVGGAALALPQIPGAQLTPVPPAAPAPAAPAQPGQPAAPAPAPAAPAPAAPGGFSAPGAFGTPAQPAAPPQQKPN
jgi:general secretion pathway protein D